MNNKVNSNESGLTIVPGMTHDLGGGFIIRRVLPFHKRRMVGPYVFLDHLGPLTLVPNEKSDVRPHPHIGLSTLTYLIEGRIVHRDHLGTVQEILPGEVNWMTAGKGIVHSERAHPDDYGKPVRMQGLQFWVALPDAKEDVEPTFAHYGSSQIPVYSGSGFTAKVVTGSQFGLSSPVAVSSPSILLVVDVQSDSLVPFTPAQENFELALYVLKGSVTYRNHLISEGSIAVLDDVKDLSFSAAAGTTFIVIGGEPIQSPRLVWWNFVSSSREKIQNAADAWKHNRFPLIPGDDQERIPLGD